MERIKRSIIKIVMSSAALVLLAGPMASADPSETPAPSFSIAFRNTDPSKGVWTIRKDHWDDSDEQGYQAFIVRIAKSKCNSVDSCLKTPSANPYYDPNQEADVFYYADCGRFPYVLRMYYAWKMGLPFSAVIVRSGTPEDLAQWTDQQIQAGVLNPNTRDFSLANSPNGSIMKMRMTVPSATGKTYNFFSAARAIISSVNTSNYRYDSSIQMPVDPDFYPVKMDRADIKPGVTIYDPSGHVAIVSEVTPSGDIYYIDSHPDNGVTHKLYNKAFLRSRPAHGAGFKAFRPIALTNVRYNKYGTIASGTLVTTPNEQLPGFSLEQFYGTTPDPGGNWAKGIFSYQGRAVDYYEYLKLNLATEANTKIRPLDDIKAQIDELCGGFQDRALDAQKAIDQGLDKKPHPDNLPQNIYQADGDWENYSTPGRDFRLRSNFYDIVKAMKGYYDRIKAHDNLIDYSGTNFKADLIAIAKSSAETCKISYKNSAGRTVTFNLLEGLMRVNRLSFDPYFCIEKRMGASTPQELATCQDDATKDRWYKAENFIRNLLVKDTTVVYGQNLQQLEADNAKNPTFYRYDFLYYIDKYIQ